MRDFPSWLKAESKSPRGDGAYGRAAGTFFVSDSLRTGASDDESLTKVTLRIGFDIEKISTPARTARG
jgi:hypothetical protein